MNYPTQKTFSNAATPAVRSKIAAALLAAGALSIGLPAHAVLPSNALLSINAGTINQDANGNITSVSGSWFGMDLSSDSKIQNNEKTALSQGTTGLVLGVTTSPGASHPGAPTAGDTNAITAPWFFGSNTGSDYLTTAATIVSATGSTATINFSGWTVTWNSIAAIPMGSGAWPPSSGFTNGVANVVCGVDCGEGDTYTLDYHGTVPSGDPSGFGNVKYALHLEGKVVVAPVAVDDTSVTTAGVAIDINVLANDSAAAGIDETTVHPSTPTQHGTTSANAAGVVHYVPNGGYSGPDSFTYTFQDKANPARTSLPATVTVSVNNNTPPTAVNDTLSVTAGTSQTIDVLANDTDLDGPPPRGNIDPTTVTTTTVGLTQPQHGTVSIDPATGVITYTNTDTSAVTDSFQYTVSDTVGATSLPATVSVTISAYPADWTNALQPGDVPILAIESGSYFGMELTLGKPTITDISAGADGGIILGAEQVAAGSHGGSPAGTEVTGIDQPWLFASSTGMHYTTNGGIEPNTTGTPGDGTYGTLNFNNRWFVTWNQIPAINMGGSSQDAAAIKGKAGIACNNPRPCGNGSSYVLTYSAHVPAGDPSGFGGVPYSLHLVGHVHFLNTTLTSDGSISQGSLGLGMRLTETQLTNAGVAADTDLIARGGTPCVGDCFDFRVTGLAGGRAKVVLPLKFGIRPNSTYRRYMNGAWGDFVTSSGDTVKSAPLVAGTGNCPAVNDASYTPGLTAGNRCVQLDIADNGLNDANAAVGTIDDPSGVAAGAVVVPPKDLSTSSSGCSLSADPVSVLKRADWLLLLGFVGWLGLVARRKRAS